MATCLDIIGPTLSRNNLLSFIRGSVRLRQLAVEKAVDLTREYGVEEIFRRPSRLTLLQLFFDFHVRDR